MDCIQANVYNLKMGGLLMDGSHRKPEKSVPLYQQAYQIIRAEIMSNQIKPGDILTEEKFSEQLSISRTPIRAALQQLVFDGLAMTDSNKSVIVTNVTAEDIKHLTDVRIVLETLTVRLLEKTATPEKIGQLKRLHAKEVALSKEKDYLAMIDMDYQFHVKMAELTDNPFLVDCIQKIKTATNRFHILSGTMERYCAASVKEHEEILGYIEKGRYDFAEIAMRNHISGIASRIFITD